EAMLQQTQVARVVPRYEAFLRRFPDAATCAAATPGEVVRMWDGLGYNRRAVNLHRSAVAIVERHDGRVPADLAALLALPGVGPYTARAVLAFAFEAHHGVLDVNAGRMLARIGGRPLAPREAQRRADELVPTGRVWEWNQAVLDLGATVCIRRHPRCEECPVAAACAWRGQGHPVPDPAATSAAAGRPQSRFEGSDRQLRGRVIAVLRSGPADATEVGSGDRRTGRILDALVGDGLVERLAGGRVALAGLADEVGDQAVDDGGLLDVEEVPGVVDDLDP
ncbi:MAG TPA: A/G-specific adenine glycosylase, partial [Acidimicrobiales bacterium]|nr:A/G-specific adenine glycosylase [Acidimicrobiales bacterium]